jgi:hypothetical protein
MSDSFLTDSNQPDLAPASVEASTDSERESVQVILVGSPKGLTKIIHTLYRLGFAEVIEWSPPSPTANPRKMMSAMTRRVLLD